jgi:hypothetical protein
MLLFFPVPPSLRQAAGPLTEDLPNVFAGDPYVCGVDLTLERPSPRGIEHRLLLREFFGPAGQQGVEGQHRMNKARSEGQRGHLA